MQKYLILSLMFLTSCALMAQSPESGWESKNSLQAGAELSVFNPDFYCTSNSPLNCGTKGLSLLKGVGFFVDYNLHVRYGTEAEFRWLNWGGPNGHVESTYLVGPRYRLYRTGRFDLWGKFLIGDGAITTQYYGEPGAAPVGDTFKGSVGTFAPGLSLDYHLTGRVSARVDYEFQRWPNFAVQPPHNHGISPNGLSYGVVYTLIR